MKVILSENQLRQIIVVEQLVSYLSDTSLNESIDYKKLMKKIRSALISGVAAAAIIAAIGRLDVSDNMKSRIKNEIAEMEAQISHDDSIAMHRMDSIRTEKINAVREFMNTSLKNQGFSESSTKLTPDAIVDACEAENFDIPFVMAAANLESCFGATRRAKTTNSVFSVGCYDNGQNKVTYSSQDDSVVPYIKTLKKDYLVNGKTLSDLLKPGQFVNYDGKRYASDKSYENKINSIRNKIVKKYPILAMN